MVIISNVRIINNASRSVIDTSSRVIDDIRVTLQTVVLLTDDSWDIIYNRNMFKVQGAGVITIKHFSSAMTMAQNKLECL